MVVASRVPVTRAEGVLGVKHTETGSMEFHKTFLSIT